MRTIMRNDQVISSFLLDTQRNNYIAKGDNCKRIRNHLGHLKISKNGNKLYSYNQIIGEWERGGYNGNGETKKILVYTKTSVMGQWFSFTTSKIVNKLRDALKDQQVIDWGYYNDNNDTFYPKEYQFKKKKVKISQVLEPKTWFKDNNDKCSICLCDHKYRIIKTNCGHRFHKKCFISYIYSLEQNAPKLCPLCKQHLIA